MTIEQAIEKAKLLSSNVETQGIQLAFNELESEVSIFQDEGYPIEDIIPRGTDTGMGFALRSADGKSFWEIYSKLIRKNLCDSDGELHKLVQTGISTSVGAVLTALVSGLGIPAIALGIMVPIASIIFNVGVDTFCEITEKNEK